MQNNGIMSLKFFIIIESNSQKAFSAIVLYTNMAAVTSHENQESLNFLEASCDKLNCTLYLCLIIVLVCLLFSPSFLDCFYCVNYKIKIRDYPKTFLIRFILIFVIFMQITQFLGKISPETNSGISQNL